MNIIFTDKITKEEFILDIHTFNYLDNLNAFDEFEEITGCLQGLFTISKNDIEKLSEKLSNINLNILDNEMYNTIQNLIKFINKSNGFIAD